MNNIDSYAYAVGRVKALESHMLDQGKVQRLIEAQDYEEAVKGLSDSEYSLLSSGSGFESALDDERRRAHLTIASFSPDPYFTGVFFAWEDFLYLKALLKGSYLASSGVRPPDVPEKALGWLSSEDIARIADLAVSDAPVEEEEAKLNPASAVSKLEGAGFVAYMLKQAAYAACSEFSKTGDPLEIDNQVDKTYYEYAGIIASSRHADWLKGYIGLKADMTNALVVLRAVNAGKGDAFVGRSLVPGGTLPVAELIAAFKDGKARIQRILEATSYWKLLAAGFDAWDKTGALRLFEMAAEGMLSSYARQTRQMTSGYEPVIGYLISKDAEASLLRKVLTGKSKRLSSQFIRERLSDGNA